MPRSLIGPEWPSVYYTYIMRWPCNFREFKVNEPYYVGAGIGNRYTHWRDFEGIHVDRELKKLGFKPNVEIILADSKKSAENKETELVLKFGRRDLGTGLLFNRSNGQGRAGRIFEFSEEARLAIGRKHKGRIRTPEIIAKWLLKYKGHHHSDETKKLIGIGRHRAAVLKKQKEAEQNATT